MTRGHRALAAAAALSIAVHLALLFGPPPFGAPRSDEAAPPPPIEARIVSRPDPPPVAAVASAPVPVHKAEAPRRRLPRKVLAAPKPVPAPVVPSYDEPVPDLIAADDRGPASGPPATESTVAANAVAPDLEPAPPPAEYPLRNARLVFDLYFGAAPTKVGQVTHTWAHDGHHYQAETVAEAIGFVSLFLGGRFVQRSSGVLTADGLAPSEYRAELGSAERTETARFDWAARKLALASKGEQRVLDLPAGAQDPLSVLHQLYFMKPLPDPSRLDIVTGRKLYQHVYRIAGLSELETPIGIVRALHLKRRDADGSRMDVWLDLDRELLPARIHSVDRKGMVLEQVIREARLDVAVLSQ